MQRTERRAALRMLQIAGVSINVCVCVKKKRKRRRKIFPSDSLCEWKGRMLTYMNVCSPSPSLPSCCCYVMSVCYETLHWKTRAHWSASSEHTQTHTHTRRSSGDWFHHPFLVWKRMHTLSLHSCIQYVCTCECVQYHTLTGCTLVNPSVAARLWKCAELPDELLKNVGGWASTWGW